MLLATSLGAVRFVSGYGFSHIANALERMRLQPLTGRNFKEKAKPWHTAIRF
jgi:hypothetical protein